jgi:Tol biopolymer transport system component
VNSPFIDFTPEISKDGLSLYFGSDRPGGMSPAPDIWVAQRQSLEDPWEAPVNLGPVVNSPAADAAPHLSQDGHYLYFSSSRQGSLRQQDLWVSP